MTQDSREIVCVECAVAIYEQDSLPTMVALSTKGLRAVLYLGDHDPQDSLKWGFLVYPRSFGSLTWGFNWRRQDGRPKRWDANWEIRDGLIDNLLTYWCSKQCFGVWLARHIAADKAVVR